MTRRRGSENPIELFPFLAVLMSAMGALCLLLLAITRQAQLSREAEARARSVTIPAKWVAPDLGPLPELIPLPDPPTLPPFDPTSAPLAPLPDLVRVVDPRPAAKEKVASLQAALDDAKQAIPAPVPSTDRLTQLSNVIASLKRQLASIAEEQQRVERDARKWRAELEQLRENKGKAERRSNHVENRYAVVPYTGPNGVKRRPIYLEVRDGGITLQPEGVSLSPDLFAFNASRNNPLAELVNAIVDELREERDDGEPYPLLLVRPDGIAGYYVAQRALDSVSVPVGYELIDEDVELAYPPAEPRVKEVAERIAARAKRQFAELVGGPGANRYGGAPPSSPGASRGVAPLSALSGGSLRPSLTPARAPSGNPVPSIRGGLSANDPPPPTPVTEEHSAREALRRYHAGPFGRSLVNGNRHGGGRFGSAEPTALGREGDGHGPRLGDAKRDGFGLGNGVRTGSGRVAQERVSSGPAVRLGSPTTDDAGAYGNGNMTNDQEGSVAGVQNSASRGGVPGVTGAPEAPGVSEDMANGSRSGANGTIASAGAGPGGDEGEAAMLGAAGQSRPMGGAALGGRGGGQKGGVSNVLATGETGTGATGFGDGQGSSSAAAPGLSSGGSGLGRDPLSTAGGGAPGSPGNDSVMGGLPGGGQGDSATGSMTSNGGAGSVGGAPGATNGSSGNSPITMQGGGANLQLIQQPNESDSSSGSSNATLPPLRYTFDELVFKPKASSSPTEGTISEEPDPFEPILGVDDSVGQLSSSLSMARRPFRRSVFVECRADGIHLLPDGPYLPIERDEDTAATVRALYTHIADRARRWGSAGPSYRWQPVAEFLVRPDGMENYYRLRFALLGSRVEVGRQTIDSDVTLGPPAWGATTVKGR